MLRRFALGAVAAALAAPATFAQHPRIEIGGNVGWTFSDGVSSGVDGSIWKDYTRVDPADSTSFGSFVGFFVTPDIEVGLLWDRQMSALDLGGASKWTLGDFEIDNYHGYVAYNFGDPDSTVRPFVLGGLGVTNYGGIDANLGNRTIGRGDEAKFSSTWAAGLKLYPAESLGIKAMARWTPTYIKSDAEGWWCDPWYGCYVVGDAQYANQFSLSVGLILRF